MIHKREDGGLLEAESQILLTYVSVLLWDETLDLVIFLSQSLLHHHNNNLA